MTRPETLIAALSESLQDAAASPEGVAAPAAVIWTDPTGEWRPVVSQLRETLPHLYEYGPYDSATRRGPGIWLKCVIDRTLPDVSPPVDAVPILYLPGVSRQVLRSGADCAIELQPLIELQFRGTVWHQRNGRDWTVDAFLTSDTTLGLDISMDAQTRAALLRALPSLANEPLQLLRGHRLEAEDFDRLSVGDPVRDLLHWLAAPEDWQHRWPTEHWETFRSVCVREFSFDPEKGGPAAAADGLVNGGGRWDDAWKRFCEAPQVYRGVVDALRTAMARDLLVAPHRQPQYNEAQEEALRKALEPILGQPHELACGTVLALEQQHRDRRRTVWASLGLSSLSIALEPLARLATLATSPAGGASIASVVDSYVSDGWRCDRAALEALTTVDTPAERVLIAKLVAALYRPWADKSARHFQCLVQKNEVEYRGMVSGVTSAPGTCIAFTDGLRFDVATVLQERLEAAGLKVRLSHRVSPLPTVTATAKPVASPAYDVCRADGVREDFAPYLGSGSQPVSAARLRDELARRGLQILDAGDDELALGSKTGGWTEIGQLDELGHALGAKLVQQIEKEVSEIIDHVLALLGRGWQRVRIVTDHGWLLVPGGLPKVQLPAHLVSTKWARCASVRGESSPDVATYGWHWYPLAQIASPPGIGSFFANVEYAHGGVSLQECVVPDLLIERNADLASAKIQTIEWRGMRCRVAVDVSGPGLRVALRRNWKKADPEADRIAADKALGPNGQANLVVERDQYEGSGAVVVVLDAQGKVLDYRPTTIGEPS
jgi:hypothetical protein